jgi:hypothetical protein
MTFDATRYSIPKPTSSGAINQNHEGHMQASFTPSGKWFVFDQDTGSTIRRNFPDAKAAFEWIARERLKPAR